MNVRTPATAFDVRCPRCGEEGVLTRLLSSPDTLFCMECRELMTPDDVRAHLAEWRRLLGVLGGAESECVSQG